MKTRTSVLLLVYLFTSLACALPFLNNDTSAPQDPSLSPIDANAGMHVYHVDPTSQTCKLTTEESDEVRIITFTEGHVEITNTHKDGSTIYDEIGDDMYHRITDTGRPIVISFSSTGFMMEVFEVEGENNAACGTYTFTIKE